MDNWSWDFAQVVWLIAIWVELHYLRKGNKTEEE